MKNKLPELRGYYTAEQFSGKWTPSEMGKKGGKNSVKNRFAKKSKDEISDIMSKVRKGKFTSSKKMVDLLNESTKTD